MAETPPIRSGHFFISHASADRAVADRLVAALRRDGVACWIAPDDVPAGAKDFGASIVTAIEEAHCLLLLYSTSASESIHVLRELQIADEDGKQVIPLRIDRAPLRGGFRFRLSTSQLIEFGDDVEATIARIYPALGITVARKQEVLSAAPDAAPADAAESAPDPVPTEPEATGPETLPALSVFRDRLKDGGEGPELVIVPAGRFWMGSPVDEEGRYDREGPRHEVTIGYRFAVGRYAVTFEEYDRFCDATGRERADDENWGRGRMPVIHVNWHDAVAYCGWLSAEMDVAYRLPSEAEWEYACRAGPQTAYPWGGSWDASKANGARGGPGRTTEVGSYPPNDWGLHDMNGNVFEWVADAWHDSYDRAPADGTAWVDRSEENQPPRVARGGSWFGNPWNCRSSYRVRDGPGLRTVNLGFRVTRTL
jgi:formylglycine-generating enzyme required for sulfatase activity